MIEDISWDRKRGEVDTPGPNKDYDINLKVAKTFIDRVKSTIPSSMRVYVSDTHGLIQSVLMMSWKPPIESKRGNYATPINLHQANSEFVDTMNRMYNIYCKTIKDFNDKQQMKMF